MEEYQFVNSMFNQGFRYNSSLLIEDKGEGEPHKVQIINNTDALQDYSVYRFDPDDKNNDFLPFFNKTMPVLDGLRSFSDYIVLVLMDEELFVLIVEMKRGKDKKHAYAQLDATGVFIDYILSSAQRVKSLNGSADMDFSGVKVRKIHLKECTTNKRTTKPKDIDFSQPHIPYQTNNHLPLAIFCK